MLHVLFFTFFPKFLIQPYYYEINITQLFSFSYYSIDSNYYAPLNKVMHIKCQDVIYYYGNKFHPFNDFIIFFGNKNTSFELAVKSIYLCRIIAKNTRYYNPTLNCGNSPYLSQQFYYAMSTKIFSCHNIHLSLQKCRKRQ
jgi:hypothetical protein